MNRILLMLLIIFLSGCANNKNQIEPDIIFYNRECGRHQYCCFKKDGIGYCWSCALYFQNLSVNKEVYDTACDEKDREEEWGKNLKEMLNK